ncbi:MULTISPECIES: hypothetical protein [Rhizobium]|uniref:Uncharacterized protein n=1 Tax=Rhizobium changzhiense TaxID=2692317 RepID=A0ABR6ABZ1_9HYPH|nr:MULTISPECIES: hypothetical protein [Rhizobium]MBA5804174.1 hypothetical protein [Rhizobium changzhiense]MCH4546135.1 hypothetical protein [Rhizobium changzhiense]MCV9942293.1 hypothetical protein [Rhizobium sp. BT-175]MCW0015746.1 hypothetical protein [Rhizobium sp. BT-226]
MIAVIPAVDGDSLSPTLISGLSAQGRANPQLSMMPKTERLSALFL